MSVLMDSELGVTVLLEWFKTQPNLPLCIEKPLLRRFIYACYGDLEKTKKLIELNYKLRNKYLNIFLNRDPCDEASKNITKYTDMLILPGVTPQCNKILLYRLSDELDVSKFDFTEAVKVFFMLADARFATFEPYGGLAGGEVPIFDMSGFGLKHLTKIVLSSLKIYMKFTQEAQPIRLKEIHVINCSPILDKILSVVRPFIKSEVFKLIKFHLPNTNSLYEYVPKEMLPNEYGGNAGLLADIKHECIEILEKQRDYLMDEKYWKVSDFNKNFDKKCQNKLSSLNVDFKRLTID